ncbi:conjugal transfer ATP-binding protein TraC [Legionella massiliensis]|uniref:Conjugal transfer ATP-binding protein TraC n=1 Tax=Legionella massiliensis TaxID=1034943 RepID=A0A078L5N8_9GAMM|nr:type IV secretion system protein TraC [Legionella massiliensis]CDZ79404.1 conjugal transfer ATP-binding protein TraC [Legionella massiliensis]CEE15142.1 AAA-like domain protein [Legionella massiliensis]
MGLKVTVWRDKARQILHRFSHQLGETLSHEPQSLVDQQKGCDSLQVDLPSFRSLLPYETMDEALLFINQNSIGFGLAVLPSCGADESLMHSLAQLYKNKLPAGVDCTVMLYKHRYVSQRLSESFSPILKRGGIFAELARMSIDFHLKAIKKGYTNGRNVPAQLADYSAYLFISTRHHAANRQGLMRLREDWESELKAAGFGFYRLEHLEFKSLMRTLVSPSLDDMVWPFIDNDEDGLVRDAIPSLTSVYEIHDKNVDISSQNSAHEEQTVRVVNCQIAKWPDSKEGNNRFGLWQTPDLFANLLKPEHGIQCPFLISFTIRGVNREKTKKLTKRRAKDANSNNNAVQNFLAPGTAEQAAQWNLVHQEVSQDNMDLLPTFYNLMLFTDPEHEREHVAKVVSSYRQHGFTLTQSHGTQWLRFLGSLPFVLTEGLFSRLELMGLTKRLSNYNVANLLPLVADFKGCKEGLLMPTYRHQLFFYDPFDDRNLSISNYNRLTVASSGAGKSYLQQALLLDGLSRGHQIFVIDLGESYKHLCQMVGGTYVDATTISLNPFTLFDFEGTTEIEGTEVNNYIQIRDLLAIMASPEQGLDEVQKDWLLDALLTAWRAKKNRCCIDDVLEALKEILHTPVGKNDRRLKDLLVLLGKYGKDGLYGSLCNGQTPLFNKSMFTVFELGGFESNPQLLIIVMFVMIVIIQGQFYHADRRLKKQCNFDEIWRALMKSSNPLMANFIEQGWRTARKYLAGFSGVTQQLSDTENTAQGRAIAACSDTKFIMKQGAFKEYIAEHPTLFSPLQQRVIESFGEAKLQGFSDFMLQCGGVTTFHRYFSDPFSRVLFSTSGDEFGEIEALIQSGVSLTDAIKQVALKYYGALLCD